MFRKSSVNDNCSDSPLNEEQSKESLLAQLRDLWETTEKPIGPSDYEHFNSSMSCNRRQETQLGTQIYHSAIVLEPLTKSTLYGVGSLKPALETSALTNHSIDSRASQVNWNSAASFLSDLEYAASSASAARRLQSPLRTCIYLLELHI